jgi:predicted anti-sigma-YlaC factor YlaD
MPDHDTCHNLLDGLCDYLDGTAAETLCAQIERHMQQCPDCRIVVDTLRKTISLYQIQEADVDLPNEVHERLVQHLQLDDLLKGDAGG